MRAKQKGTWTEARSLSFLHYSLGEWPARHGECVVTDQECIVACCCNLNLSPMIFKRCSSHSRRFDACMQHQYNTYENMDFRVEERGKNQES
jgi:hypothetical protein